MPNSSAAPIPTDDYGLVDLVADIRQFQPRHVQIYLITRQLKPGQPVRSRAYNRFEFQPYRVDADEKLQTFVLDRVNVRMATFVNQHYELIPFEVFPAEENCIVFRSPRQGDVGAFRDLIDTMTGESASLSQQTGADEPRLTRDNAEGILPQVWAYCVKLQPDDPAHAPFWCFQRYSSSRIAGLDAKKPVLSFTSNTQLHLLTGPTFIFECYINCLFHKDQFYIFDKDKFEQIAGLDEQYQQRAEEIITIMTANGGISGLQHLAEACTKNTPFRNRLIQLSNRGLLTTIDASRLAKMLATAQKHSQQLPLDDEGNISLSCIQDAKLLADLLDDAYLESDQTGYLYNASRKKRTTV